MPGSGRGGEIVVAYTGQPNRDIPRIATRVRVEASVDEVADDAFHGCARLEHAEFLRPGPREILLGWIGSWSGEFRTGIRRIGRESFHGCRSLRRVGNGGGGSLPATLEEIDRSAFQGCVRLELELREGIKYIGRSAFRDCESLKRVKIPSSVSEIYEGTFQGCVGLVDVQLHEGVAIIGARAFMGCRSLERIGIPPGVVLIGDGAFQNCERLREANLNEGLRHIGPRVFMGCKYLKLIKIPPSVESIGMEAFRGCENLPDVNLHEGLESIGPGAFTNCRSLKFVRIPSTVWLIEKFTFYDCKQVLAVGIHDKIGRIDRTAFQGCTSIRNIILPSSSEVKLCFEGCNDMLRIFGSYEEVLDSLKGRFNEFPIHKLCYWQSRQPHEETIDQFKRLSTPLDKDGASLNECGTIFGQDSLRMTPLHILVCSGEHNLGVYRFIIDSYPASLATKDKWGYIPVFYAIWANAPNEVIQFMISSHRSAFPEESLDWDGMVETLCRAGASLDIVEKLLLYHQASFSEQGINWDKAARELVILCLLDCGYDSIRTEFFLKRWRAMIEAFSVSMKHQQLIQGMLEVHQTFSFYRVKWQATCEEIVDPLSGWWRLDGKTSDSFRTFHFLARCRIAERFNAIGVRRWRMDLQRTVEEMSSVESSKLRTHFDALHSKLTIYEKEFNQLFGATTALELALWRAKVVGLMSVGIDDNFAGMKERSHVNCGASIIIPCVIPFLLHG